MKIQLNAASEFPRFPMPKIPMIPHPIPHYTYTYSLLSLVAVMVGTSPFKYVDSRPLILI